MKYLLLIISLLIILVTPFIGDLSFTLTNLLSGENLELFVDLRLSRLIVTFLAGSGLAVCGMVFQSLFRNDLATPYTLGIASGASFGAVLGIVLGLSNISFFSLFGALSVSLLSYYLARTNRKLHINKVLLVGVAVAMISSSFIMFSQIIVGELDALRIMRWLMGSINVVGLDSAYLILPFYFIGMILVFIKRTELNLILMGDNIAKVRGVDIEKTRTILYIGCTLLIAGIVSECGPIGFVGLIVPHICKRVFNLDHRVQFWANLYFGGVFLLLCDIISKSLFSDFMFPIGVITSLIGGPFFLYILIKKAPN